MSTAEPINKLIVQKYGGATLSNPTKIKQVALKIFKLHKSGAKVVVVVSAMGQTTNQLIELAHQVSIRPSLRELDMLLTVGERTSMALLSMALNDLGCSAISFTGSQAGILTDDAHINANIIDVKAFRVDEALTQNKIVILAGFQGVSANTKEITTLGRGGSDITAVAMAGYLKADRCEILKDVAAVFTADPKLVKTALPIAKMNYQHLLEMTSWGAKVLHYRSVKLAAEKEVNLYVGAAMDNENTGTSITSSVNFETQNVLAINSFSHICELKFNTDSENFQNELQQHLQKNQIGQLQLLYSGADKHYFTAPQETLISLREFENLQNFYKICDSDLASVSITYTQPATPEKLAALKKLLLENNIEIFECFLSTHSLHFFINSQQKNRSVQLFHNLIPC